ncbi:MAG TPA: bifunctional DNA-binding transcriptional regulator/O6-methylguanine-DNA methyltransferase Ada [Ktedonobacteraceae bacterium]|jgi:AraC family transcriptional regulator of adaptative response/methylated-DNA-[protein]-cysteine methyltransferase|nr:bifunctional DNA-binding transcriptional regulator/O6-methylguanine-DNA methyltransferase Ada [Ktedonobacteraceae bacterium]
MYEEDYWQAVLNRDRSSNGRFVYAVRSTGIYCNPSCSSRKPKREQVVFFARPEEAEEAGFRPCKRCSPKHGDPQLEIVQQTCRYIEEHLEAGLEELGAQVGLSPFHLQRVFKRVMGISPRQYAEAKRLEQLKEQLKEGETVTGALYEVGFSSSSRLYERAPEQLGMTPTAYRNGGKGMHIRYTIVDSPLGRLLVGATEKGVCAVCIGDDDAQLEAALKEEYARAEIQRDGENDALSRWVSAIVRHLEGQEPHLDLPIDVQATAFQWRVWQELRNIPYGQTASYSQIAKAMGQPKAVRAVANACANNPVAIVVPCHRVIHSNGRVDGYRWGSERKKKLLEQEARGK